MGFSPDTEKSKKRVVISTDGKTSAVLEEERRRWEGLHPEILALIFVKLPLDGMVRSVPFVCKPWMEVVAGPYCWRDIDLQPWCRRRATHAVGLVVKKLIRRSKCTVQRLSTFRMGVSGFSAVANCGRYLKVLEIPESDITDKMILKHIKPLPNLTLLDISDCSNITAKGIEAFGTHCKSLIHLKRNMWNGPKPTSHSLDDSEAEAIANTMPNIQRLEFFYAEFDRESDSEELKRSPWSYKDKYFYGLETESEPESESE
ncbi:hypothetical protein L2E82_30147 [Cichorium intybus]|uniref:Uncharacterized protein n=1 Tax=Cichorium intybus TaxID=13427 RepID=A0ACB9CZX8_CICIN|nr:hypothetical protein L2E82_30147 [Cichorium intybus]